MRHTAGVALSSFLIGAGIGVLIWSLVEDNRRYQKARQRPLPQAVQFMSCDHDQCTWSMVGNDAAQAYVAHLATEHVRGVVGEVGE